MPTPAVTSRSTCRPGIIIRARHRLWREDRHEGDEQLAVTTDGGETEQQRHSLGLDPNSQSFERVEPARLDVPTAEDLLLRAYRLSLLYGSAPLLSLQSSRVIPTKHKLMQVSMSLEESCVERCGWRQTVTRSHTGPVRTSASCFLNHGDCAVGVN